jgi:hypothetical protein
LSQIFRSFEANSTAIQRTRAGYLAKFGFSAEDYVKSDRLLTRFLPELRSKKNGAESGAVKEGVVQKI